MKLTLSASTFKASGLKGRLPSKQLHSAENKMYCVGKPNWLRLERVQWGCRETLQCCRAKTSIVTELSKNKPLPPATRTEKIHLRLHDCHSELTLLSWLWRGSQDIFNQCLSPVLVEGRKKISQGPQLQKNLKTEASVRMCPLPAGLWFPAFNPTGETLPVVEVLLLLLLLLASFLNQVDWLLVFFATVQSEIQSEVS